MSQRLRAERLLENVAFPPADSLVKALREILDESQNLFENGGKGDGSISEEAWVGLRTVVTGLSNLSAGYQRFLRRLS